MSEQMTSRVPRPYETNRVVSSLLRTLVSKRTPTREDLDTVLCITIQKVVEALRAEAITLYLVDADKTIHFAYVYYSNSLYLGDADLQAEYEAKAARLKRVTLQPGQGIVGRVISAAKGYITPDAKGDPDFHWGIDDYVGFHTLAMITVPLKSKDVIGAIQVINRRQDSGHGSFTEEDLALVQEVADYSTRIIEKVNNPDLPFSDVEMATYISRLTNTEFMELDEEFELDEKLLALVGVEALKRYHILPLKKTSTSGVKVAMVNPLDLQLKDGFEIETKLTIDEVAVAPESQIRAVIQEFVGEEERIGGVADAVLEKYGETTETIEVDDDASEDSEPIVKLANTIIEDAYSRAASDIHIEPFESETLVRYRVDGVLEEKLCLPPKAVRALVSRLKIMASLDIAERRLPQDGRIRFKDFTRTGIDIDLRVSTGPMAFGEKVVMRILDKSATSVGLEVLGLSPENLTTYREAIRQPFGMILHVGPTGSGKTTTLYSALTEINSPTINIQTAEDPIEYSLKGINQMQMRADIGLTFATALRCFLRQDPDVIMVGEIRDRETAEIGIQAALTGHLLFSTLHTNNAAGTVTRLLDMGIEPFLVSGSLLLVCAQRLMRKLCKCKIPYEPSADEAAPYGLEGMTLFKPRGCKLCNGTGYKGRTGTHELLGINEEIRHLINERAPSDVIAKAGVRGGMIPISQDSLNKVKQGITSLEEALRVVRMD